MASNEAAGEAGADAPPPAADPPPGDEAMPEPVVDEGRTRENVSFDSARELEVDGMLWLQDIVVPDQNDYYSFQGEAGAFYEIRTDRQTFSPDVVISLYDEAQNLIGQNDHGEIWPGDAIDARLVIRAPEDGTYFVRVEDPWTTASFFNTSFPLRFYHVSVQTVQEGSPGFAIANGSDPTEVTFETDETSGYAYATIVGEFGTTPGAFELTATTDKALLVQVLTSGSSGNGSTTDAGELRVLSDQARVVAQIDRSIGQAVMTPPVTDGRYRIELQGAETLGDNPFYAVDLVLIPDNPAEHDDVGNGEVAGAEPIEMVDGTWRHGLLLSSLPQDDVDTFQFEATAGEFADIQCEAQSGGSGVLGLSAELSDGSGEVLGSGVEMATANLRIDHVEIVETGPQFLRLSSTGSSDATSVEPWVRCAVVVGP